MQHHGTSARSRQSTSRITSSVPPDVYQSKNCLPVILSLGWMMHPSPTIVSPVTACDQWAIAPAGRPASGSNHRRRDAAHAAITPPRQVSTSVGGAGTAVIATKRFEDG
jgi:hypothetical protein